MNRVDPSQEKSEFEAYAFASKLATHLGMRRKRLAGSAEVIARLKEDPRRGDVFWWLYREYPAIVARTQGRPILWKALLLEIQALGLKNADGQIPDKVESLRKTFARVRALRKREAEERAQKAPKPRPTNTPPPMARPVPVPAPVAVVSASPSQPGISRSDWLRNQALSRSGKIVGRG